MNWEHVRNVVVTVDPEKYTGKEAWEQVNSHRAIAGLIRNIERGKKVKNEITGKWEVLFEPKKIKTWMWFLEWHENGRPHWHLLIEMEAKGRAGMIGGDRLRHYWHYGTWVHEDYIKSETHWKKLTGYFGNKGYFNPKKGSHKDLKGHQVTLPKWAKDRNTIMRRSGSKVVRKKSKKSNLVKLSEWFEKKGRGELIDKTTGEILREGKPKRERRTYRAILESCGAHTRIKIRSEKSFLDMEIDVPYKAIRGMDGEYKKGLGYCFALSGETLKNWLNKIVKVNFYRGSEAFEEIWNRLDGWEEYRIRQGGFVYLDTYKSKEVINIG